MDVREAITTRGSITRYTDEGVDREQLAEILDSARWAPSAGNMQTWEFIVVEDEELKEKLSQFARNQPHLREAPVVIAILSDLEKAERQYGDRGRELYAIQETAAAMQNMLLSAHDQGLGAAWVGSFDEEGVRDLLRVPDRLRPVALLTVGHPREEPEQPTKFPITNITYMNRYGERITPIYDKIIWRGLREYSEDVRRRFKNLKDRYT